MNANICPLCCTNHTFKAFARALGSSPAGTEHSLVVASERLGRGWEKVTTRRVASKRAIAEE
jgi:hypothetical protein